MYDLVVGAADHTVLVAEDGGRVIALCRVFARPARINPQRGLCTCRRSGLPLSGSR